MDLVPHIFHEQQEGNLCAQHCLNALLQGPYFTAIDLAELARQLDQREQDALGGRNSGNAKSQNMDDSGFFSVQVLSEALTIWNIQIVPWGAKEVSGAKAEPEREAAFICNLNEHWYTLRRFGSSTQRWYDLNSIHPRPKHMSATYLGMTLSQLEAEGYSIFVVRPLNKDDSQPETVPLSSSSSSSSSSTKPKPVEIPAPTPALAQTTFLADRQEMERIRRQRIEDRERTSQQAANPSLSTALYKSTAVATLPRPLDTSSNKRTRADQAGSEDLEQSSKRTSKGTLVTAKPFLPRCEADDMAAAMPLESAAAGSEGQQQKQQAFGGAGHRLGGSPPQLTTDLGGPNILSPPSGFSLENTDFGQTDGDGDGDAEWEMMQQAIAMSLQGSRE
ncbi:Ataxin-3 [Mortierella claussenii]|nr:Ataxin-3 [Mortierella claussenii]